MFVAVDRFVTGSWFVPVTVSFVWTVRLSGSEEAVLLRLPLGLKRGLVADGSLR